MAQQINFYTPILLTPKRYFSAFAMLQALLALALGLVAFSIWAEWSTAKLRGEGAQAARAYQAEKRRLTQALASRPAARDTTALQQELAQARKALQDRQWMLDEWVPSAGSAGASRAELLRTLAQTLPEPVWLTEVRLSEGRVEIAGLTLQPEALRPWLDRLAAQPLWAGMTLSAVKVERSETPAGGPEAWSFRVVSGRAGSDLGVMAP